MDLADGWVFSMNLDKGQSGSFQSVGNPQNSLLRCTSGLDCCKVSVDWSVQGRMVDIDSMLTSSTNHRQLQIQIQKIAKRMYSCYAISAVE